MPHVANYPSTENQIENLDDIYQTWLESASPCSECGRHDDDLVTEPFFSLAFPGSVDPVSDDIDVMMIGEAPGGTKTGKGNELNHNYRTWKNYTEVADEAGPKEEADQSDFSVTDMSTSGIIGDLRVYLQALDDEFARTLDRENCNVYYTNYIKCQDIFEEDSIPDDPRRKSGIGGECCGEFLLPEIELINPSAILVFAKGAKHTRRVLKRLGASNNVPASDDVTDYVFDASSDTVATPFRSYNSNNPVLDGVPILTSYHFKGFRGNLRERINERGVSLDDLSEATGLKAPIAHGLATALSELVESHPDRS